MIIPMKSVLSILMLLYLSPFYAQNVKQQINAIKKNPDFLNAEATDKSREEAFSIALEELTTEVNVLFSSHISSQELKRLSKTLEVNRGASMRVFVYSSKEDIKTLIESAQMLNKQDTTKTAQDTKELQYFNENRNSNTNVNAIVVGNITPIFARMNTFTEIKSLLRQYKEEGKLHDFNWVTKREVSPAADVIIFNDERIIAILLHEIKGKRLNYLTNKEDSIGNYSGCRAIWYIEE